MPAVVEAPTSRLFYSSILGMEHPGLSLLPTHRLVRRLSLPRLFDQKPYFLVLTNAHPFVAPMSSASALNWKIDECAAYFDRVRIRGWCHHFPSPIVAVELVFVDSGVVQPLLSFGIEGPDVAAGLGQTAKTARFDEWVMVTTENLGQPFSLRFLLADGRALIGQDALTNAAHGDPYFQSWENFISSLDAFPSGNVLELGSRARSAVVRKHRIPTRLQYVGMDILPGPNVDLVGDAHELASRFPEKRFVAAFSASVFEHLAMPWKVAIELNKILERGGIVYTSTHQTWPIHEEPWDFWCFSKYSWQTLFNAATGFEILEAVMGEPARIHACRTSPVTRDMPASAAYLGSAALVRKISETTLRWDVPLSATAHSMYPPGELGVAPTRDKA